MIKKGIQVLFIIGYLYPQEIGTAHKTQKQFPGELFRLSTEFYMPNNYWDVQEQYFVMQQYDEVMKTTNSRDYDESDILNPFAQPGDTLTTAYGSGDVNQDGQVSWDDYNEMVNNSPQNDYADIDGNGIASEQANIDLLEDFLAEEINYLPGHWNALQTPEERQAWMDSTSAIQQLDTIQYINGNVDERFISGNFATAAVLGRVPYGGNDVPEKYDFVKIGQMNVPMYKVILSDPNTGIGHGMNAFLIGEDPTILSNWHLFEPQTGEVIKITETVLNNIRGERIRIYGIRDFSSTSSPDMPIAKNILIYDIDSTASSQLFWNDPALTLSRPNLPIISPYLSTDNNDLNLPTDYKLNQNYPNPFNSRTTIEYFLPKNENVSVKVYGINGKYLETLVNEKQMSGEHKINFDASKYSSGVYLYNISTESGYSETRKMIYIK